MEGTVYKITNQINGKAYIGKTYRPLGIRFTEHKYDSSLPEADARPLYRAMRKYGIANFTIEELGVFEKGVLEEKEKEFIEKYNTYKIGYNATLGGDGSQTMGLNNQEVVEKYQELKQLTKTANFFNCHSTTIKKILIEEKIETFNNGKRGKPVIMIDKDFVKEFDSIVEASEWVLSQGWATTTNLKQIQKGIGRVVLGQRETYLKKKWENL